MANIRTLKLNLLADTTDFASGIKKASGQTDSFSGKLKSSMKSVAKSAALAGVAAAGMAVAFGVDAVKAALADQQSQTKLAKALQNTTKATKAQIASVEDSISKMQFQFGIADDKLRPAFQRLAQATGDLTKSQDLMQVVLDTSVGTGKSAEAVAIALGKAYNGNITALKRLGIPLSENIIDTKDFNGAVEVLSDTFSGQAQASAGTFAGKMRILAERWNEFKEGVGYKLIGPLSKVMDYMQNTVIPVLEQVGDGFAGRDPNKGVSNKVKALGRALGAEVADTPGYTLGVALRDVASSLQLLFDALVAGGKANLDGSESNITKLADAMTALADGINAVAGAFEFLNKHIPSGPLWQKYLKLSAFSGPSMFAYGQLQNLRQKVFGTRALGGPVTGGTSYLVGEHGPEIFTPMGGGTITPNSRINGGGHTFILNGIVDAESARRTIERVLQQSSIRTGAVNINGSLI
jgi:hypothetical protein